MTHLYIPSATPQKRTAAGALTSLHEENMTEESLDLTLECAIVRRQVELRLSAVIMELYTGHRCRAEVATEPT